MGIIVVPEESAGLNPQIKEGVYVGRLAGVTERVLQVPKEVEGRQVLEDVPRYEWVFGVRTIDGDIRMTMLTSPKFTTKSKAFGAAKALRGEALKLGEAFNTDDLVGLYGNLVIKDKARKDRTGNVSMTSEIKEIVPIDKAPEQEIVIEGLMKEPEPEEETPTPTPAAKPAPTPQPKKKK